jgi:hypothetical protein
MTSQNTAATTSKEKNAWINKLEFTDAMHKAGNEDSARRLTAQANRLTNSPTACSRIFTRIVKKFPQILCNQKIHHRVHNSSTFILGAQPDQSIP